MFKCQYPSQDGSKISICLDKIINNFIGIDIIHMQNIFILSCLLSFCISLKVQESSFKPKGLVGAPYNVTQSKRIIYYAGLAFCGDCLQDWTCLWSKKVPQLIDITVIQNNATEMRGFIGYDRSLNAIVGSFRGSANKQNWIQDFNFEVQPYVYCQKCMIHLGFMQTYRVSSKAINEKIGSMIKKYGGARFIATGHSLGAALATIYAMQIQRVFNIDPSRMQIHNYGSPRVGNSYLAQHITSRIQNRFRVVHNADLVPHLPPDFIEGYHHIANQIFLDIDCKNYQVCDDSGEDPQCSNKYFPQYDSQQHQYYFIDLGKTQC